MKLVFVDHSFHQVTGSVDFLRSALATESEVIALWDESWKGQPGVGAREVNRHRPDAALFFQTLPSHRELDRLQTTNITYVPMRDGHPLTNRVLGKLRERGIKLLAFCREQFEQAEAAGVDTCCFQYFPEPLASSTERRDDDNAPIRVFFWQRHAYPNWRTVTQLFDGHDNYQLVLKLNPDPGVDSIPPSATEIETHNIEVIEGWLPEREYASILDSCQVFVAPRLVEGIGQATLDAMSRGLTVVAADRPTANEYIEHGVSGLLYEPDEVRSLPDFNAESIGAEALNRIREGREKWLHSSESLINFVLRRDSGTRTLKISLKATFRRTFTR